jgi:hypothetical protein
MRGLILICVPILLSGCCCPGGGSATSGQRGPLPGTVSIPIPSVIASTADTVTRASMQNVAMHIDDDIRLRIHHLSGQLRDLSGQHVSILDDKHRIELAIANAEIALSEGDLSLLLNRYVFGYPKSPLHKLVVRTEGDHIVQTGIMHKIVDIPFEMTATLSVTPEGLIRIHSTSMKICGIDGQGLLRAVGASLESLLDVSGAKGVTVQKNDLLLDPIRILPPPAIAGHLQAIRVGQHEIIQTFNTPGMPAAPQPQLAAKNYVYFSGGTIRFGKLFMPAADLMAIDSDPSDPFDFYLDYYHAQLVAGYHVTQPDYGLVAYMPDFDDLETPKGRVAPPLSPRP